MSNLYKRWWGLQNQFDLKLNTAITGGSWFLLPKPCSSTSGCPWVIKYLWGFPNTRFSCLSLQKQQWKFYWRMIKFPLLGIICVELLHITYPLCIVSMPGQFMVILNCWAPNGVSLSWTEALDGSYASKGISLSGLAVGIAAKASKTLPKVTLDWRSDPTCKKAVMTSKNLTLWMSSLVPMYRYWGDFILEVVITCWGSGWSSHSGIVSWWISPCYTSPCMVGPLIPIPLQGKS